MAGLVPAIHAPWTHTMAWYARHEAGHDGLQRLEGGLKLLLVVAVALIDPDNRVLIAQRPKARRCRDYGNFPAAKSIPASGRKRRSSASSMRELGIKVKEACLAPLTFASYAYEDFHLLMPLYVCRRWDGFVRSREGQPLKWVRARDLRGLSDAARRRAAHSAADGAAGVRS